MVNFGKLHMNQHRVRHHHIRRELAAITVFEQVLGRVLRHSGPLPLFAVVEWPVASGRPVVRRADDAEHSDVVDGRRAVGMAVECHIEADGYVRGELQKGREVGWWNGGRGDEGEQRKGRGRAAGRDVSGGRRRRVLDGGRGK